MKRIEHTVAEIIKLEVRVERCTIASSRETPIREAQGCSEPTDPIQPKPAFRKPPHLSELSR